MAEASAPGAAARYDAFTGGWTNSGYTVGSIACGTITNSNKKLTFNSTAGSTYPGGGTGKKINTSAFKTLRVFGVTTSTNNTCYFGLYSAKDLRNPVAYFTVPSGSFEKTVNIENYNDEYYIGGIVYGYLTKVVLET